MRRRLFLASTLATLCMSCGTETKHLPGTLRDLKLDVAFADSQAIHLDAIAWLDLHLAVSDATGTMAFDHSYPLDFDTATHALTWQILGQDAGTPPTGLPIAGRVTATLQAYDFTNQKLSADGSFVGGLGGPVDLAVPGPDGATHLPILVTKLNGFAPTGFDLATARFMHSAVAVGDGKLLVVGGAGAGTPTAPSSFVDEIEWLDRFAGVHCTATSAGVATGGCQSFGNVPPPRVLHLALPLSTGFNASCPHASGVLVGLGQDEAGAALSDLYLFDADDFAAGSGGFTKLAVSVAGRIAAVAYATNDCRVVILGGHVSGSATVASPPAEVLTLTASGATKGANLSPPAPAAYSVAFRLDNNPDEVIVAGGRGSTDLPLDSGVSLTNKTSTIGVCDLSSAGCNGGAASMLCKRSYPVAARLAVGGILAPTLVVGDGETPCGTGTKSESVELFRSATTGTFDQFVPVTVAPTNVRWRGHTVTAIADGSALVTGGLTGPTATPATTPIASAERFVLDPQFTAAQAAAGGTFAPVGPLSGARAFHAASRSGALVWVIGGYDGSGPVATVEVFAPSL